MSTLADYKYITQEIIDEGVFNITSAEEYAEAQKYNERMFFNRKKKYRFLSEYWAMIACDAIMVPYLVSTANEEANTLAAFMYSSIPDSWFLYTLPILFYVLFFAFFVIYKKDYDWRKCLVYSSLLLFVNIVYVFLVAINCTLMYFFNKLDKELKTEPGTPHFICLKLTYIREEPVEEAAEEETGFDKYKCKDDIEFL